MKILVFGALHIDCVFQVDHIAVPGETLQTGDGEKIAGGKGANQAAALGKAGAEVYMAGKIGEDGKFILNLLESCGVKTEYVKIYDGATVQAFIQVDKNGQNAIVCYAGKDSEIAQKDIEPVLSAFGRGDIISLQNEIPFTACMMRAAKKRGMKICLNPSPYDKKIEKLPLELADIFIVNEIEGPALASLKPGAAPEEILDSLVKRFPGKEIILTAGSEGAYYGCGGIREKGDIVDLPVEDTTGAGDTFTGFYLAARAKNYSVADSLGIACKAASIAVSRKGALPSIPKGSEVF
jgi:ribokinase